MQRGVSTALWSRVARLSSRLLDGVSLRRSCRRSCRIGLHWVCCSSSASSCGYICCTWLNGAGKGARSSPICTFFSLLATTANHDHNY